MIKGMYLKLVDHGSSAEYIMQSASLWMKEHNEKTKKSENRHDKEEKSDY